MTEEFEKQEAGNVEETPSEGQAAQEQEHLEESNDTNDSNESAEISEVNELNEADVNQSENGFEQGEQQQEQQEPQEPSQEITTESVIEAILFASDEPLSAERLVNISQFNGGVKQVKKCIETLNQQYVESKRSFRIEEIAGGFQMMTLPDYNNWLKNMLKQRSDNKLSPAALETLAIVAYKQPIIRADIEAIRGVACGEIVRTLMYKGLVKIAGKAEILGRPLLYGTTKKFLQVFGLNDLKDLPKAEELKQPQQ
ncbi:MAG TPA: SMC-Scp complex subunit ScpB [Phycisphaerales bacterium]|nr:SMC-Scp complex subunit ScpB [Phycisphaerales bacterium]